MILHIIKQSDIFGSKIDLNFQKKSVYKTVFGGILTISIICLFGLGCWFYGKELILKEKPMVINSMRSVQQAERINFKGDELIFTLGVQVNGTVFDDPTIFTVKGYQEELIYEKDPNQPNLTTKKIVRTPREMQKCDPNNIRINDLKEYFIEKAELQKTYCFKEDLNEEVYMEGDYDSERFAEVYVFVEKCQNSTSSSIICKPIEEINERLKESIVTMYLSDKMISPIDYAQPFKNKGINLYALTYSNFQKELQIFFSNFYIETDSGILYEEVEQERSFVFADMKEIVIQDDPNRIVRVLMRMQKQKEYLMQRRYLKIADVVAQIGGLLKVLTALGALLSFPFAQLYLRKAIVDEVFNFDINQSQSKSKKKQKPYRNEIEKKNSIEQKSQQNTKDKFDNDLKEDNIQQVSSKRNQIQTPQRKDIETQNKPSIQEGIKHIFTITKQNIKYTFKNFFEHIFFPKLEGIRQQRQLVDQSIQKVLEKLDVLYILHKLLEVDKLKCLLLNEDQQNLFEFIPRPVISENDPTELTTNACRQEDNSQLEKQPQALQNSLTEIRQKKVSYFQVYGDEKEEDKKAVDAYQSLLNILKKKDPSDIDETLVKLIDSKILNHFQNCFNTEYADLNKSNVSQKMSQYIDSSNHFNFNSFNLKQIRSSKPSVFFNETNHLSQFSVPKDSVQQFFKDTQQTEEELIRNFDYQKCIQGDNLSEKKIRPSFNDLS